MPIKIRMPALSPTMTEGNLARWLKKEGDEVHAGDVIAEIETDKATMEYEAADEGRIGKIIVPDGAQGIKVNQPIALLLEEGEDAAALEKFAAAAPAGNGQQAGAPATPPSGVNPKTEAPPAPAGQPAPAAQSAPAQVNGGRVFASPLARRMAQQAGLDLAAIRGSGPNGRVVKDDIDKVLAVPGAAAPPARAPAVAPAATPAAAAAPGMPDWPITITPLPELVEVYCTAEALRAWVVEQDLGSWAEATLTRLALTDARGVREPLRRAVRRGARPDLAQCAARLEWNGGDPMVGLELLRRAEHDASRPPLRSPCAKCPPPTLHGVMTRSSSGSGSTSRSRWRSMTG